MGDDYLNFKEGDLVTRISHKHDIVFKIEKIEGNVVYLKGVNVRLLADSYLDDIVISDNNSLDDEEIIQRSVKNLDIDRNNYFYIPGKILHIDTEFQLTNTLANPYKIRKKAIFENCKNHQK